MWSAVRFVLSIVLTSSAVSSSPSFRVAIQSADTSARSRAISPEVKVELARLVPCGVTYHKIKRDSKIVR